MSSERVTYIIIILQLNMSHTFTVNIEYGKSDLNVAYPQEVAMMMMTSCLVRMTKQPSSEEWHIAVGLLILIVELIGH
jgi:hypothetical protein